MTLGRLADRGPPWSCLPSDMKEAPSVQFSNVPNVNSVRRPYHFGGVLSDTVYICALLV